MKRLLPLALLLCALPAKALVTDSCTEATSATLPNPPWTNIQGAMAYNASGFCYDGSGNAYSIYTGTSFTAAQYSQVQLTITNGGGVSVRMDSSGDGYIWWPQVAGTNIVKISGFAGAGSITMSSACPSVSTGDVIRLTVDSAYNFVCTNETTSLSGGGADGSSYRNAGSPGFQTLVGSPIVNFEAANAATQAATPVFSPLGPRLPTGGASITMTCSTASPTMYYTTDGSTPTTGSTAYSTPVPITTATTLKAICTASGFTNSAVRTISYTVGSLNWYVNASTGGPRHSASSIGVTADCTGLGTTPFNPSGAQNQPCPFVDFRYTWTDPWVSGNIAWVISGGDTIMVAGFENSPTSPGVISGGANSAAQGQFGYGISPIVMIPPDPPSGSSGNPTRILGANYASCGTNLVGGDPAKVEYLASINTAPYSLRLQNATWVDVECLNLNGEGAASAFGIFTGNATSGNITLKNLTIGGYNSSGIQGTVGGAWTVTDVEIQYNAKAGWNFDDGFGDPSTGSVTASYLGIDWNGCAQEWPLVHTIPIANGGCLDDSSGGYGDGIGTPETPLTFSCDHCRGTNNTQDGYDFVHAVGGTISITNSNFSGNMGGNIKIGPEASVTVYNNTVMVNCLRLKYAYPGVQTGYNTNLSDFCRAAGDGNAANMLTSAEYVGNAYAVGTAVTGTDTHFTTQLSIGNVIAPADFPFSTYGGITVTHITDDTHLTVSGSYPTNWGSSGSPLHLIYIPGGTPSSSSVDTWYNNDLIGYGATMIVGTCLTGTLVGGGSASASTDLSYCTGYTYIFKNNGVLGYVDQNCDFGSCGDGTTPPELFFGVLPTVQDYNIFTNLVACPSVGAHDSCAKLMDFVSQPASPIPSGQESNLDNFNYNITSGSDAIHGGTTPCPSTDQAGATQTSPCTIGAVVLAGTPTAATPTFSPVAGTYTGTQNVTISTSTGGATLCYTIDGTTPTANGAGTCTHGTTYSTAVSVASSLTLKAIASESGFLDSAVGSAAYTINAPVTGGATLGGSVVISGSVTVQ